MSELFINHQFMDPATLDMIWTAVVSTLLISAGTLTIYMLPWSDAEIEAVYNGLTQSRLSPSISSPSRLTQSISSQSTNS